MKCFSDSYVEPCSAESFQLAFSVLSFCLCNVICLSSFSVSFLAFGEDLFLWNLNDCSLVHKEAESCPYCLFGRPFNKNRIQEGGEARF